MTKVKNLSKKTNNVKTPPLIKKKKLVSPIDKKKVKVKKMIVEESHKVTEKESQPKLVNKSERSKIETKAKLNSSQKVKLHNKQDKLENNIKKNKKVPVSKELNGKEEKIDKKSKISKSNTKSVKPIESTLKSKKNKISKTVGKVKKTGKNSHLNDIESLKKIDPEFYDFLKKNDKKLLEFNIFDSDEEDESGEESGEVNKDNKAKKLSKKNLDDDDDDTDDDSVDNAISKGSNEDEKYHKPSGNLEVASDESDFDDENDEESGGSQKITHKLLRQWQMQLEKTNVSIEIIREVIQAFSSALSSISSDGEPGKAPTRFKVIGGSVFNSVVQLCVLHLQPAILQYLGLSARSNVPIHKNKKWEKVRGCLRYYLTDLIRLIEQVSSPNILSVLLKHMHQMAGMVGSFTTLGKTILKRLIVIWSTGDETVRVLAFLCILKITRNQQVSMLNHVLKAMYLSYVRNSKFVSPNTLPAINFMRRSLAEMFALDLKVSYQHVFLYIRQLAIHIRNAVILKKKDSFQSVYNWQYINSIRLWVDLLSTTSNNTQLQPLIYPLVTITIGVIRLIPTAQYFPLRFHCLQALITLSKETQTYIPILPLILEVLQSKTFSSKHTAVSMKPMQFTCILRLNKTQLSENGFRDEVVEQVCALVLEYCAHVSTSIAFSDLIVPTVVHLKAYLKVCRVANYSRKLKQLLDKIQENSRFIDQERRKITFGLKDIAQVEAWETQMRNKGTPLIIYYTSWVKTHEIKKRRQAAKSDTINDDYNLPMIKRKTKDGDITTSDKNDEVELFPSDSEDEKLPNALLDEEDDDKAITNKQSKSKVKNKKQSTKKTIESLPEPINVVEEQFEEEVDGVDIVKDLDLDDW